jgi:hypothetical protein
MSFDDDTGRFSRIRTSFDEWRKSFFGGCVFSKSAGYALKKNKIV